MEEQHGSDMRENLEVDHTHALCVPEIEQEPVKLRANYGGEHLAVKENVVEPVGIGLQPKYLTEFVASEVVENVSHSGFIREAGAYPLSTSKKSRKFVRHSQMSGQVKKSSTLKSKQPHKVNVEGRAACKICGNTEDIDYVICSSCKAGYHGHCLVPAVTTLPDSPWLCPTCAATSQGSPVLQSSAETTEGQPHEVEGVRSLPPVTEHRLQNVGNVVGSLKNRKGDVCTLCGKNDQQTLICNSCGSAYHMDCLSPALKGVPKGNWFCPMCIADGKKGTEASHLLYEIEQNLHGEETKEPSQHCAVNDQIGEDKEPAASVENTVQHHATEVGKVCKLCGIGDKEFLRCCDACSKPYHLTCLKPPLKKSPRSTWYCPSCLCRVCKVDSDDDKILLCDACDEGYHTFCLSPPLEKIPAGSWYCPSCNSATKVSVAPRARKESIITPNVLKKSMEERDRKELPKRERKSMEPKRST